MCDICGRIPCHPNCPNADPPEPTYVCDNCGRGIYEGAKFYDIGGLCYCQDCARRSCDDILKGFGGEVREISLPICESCQSEIQGKYIVFQGRNYCENCFTDYGEELIEEIFGKAETAEKPEE